MTKRKAFTVIELIIVIGVIGILSGVLIPTFINLASKANIASDQSLIKNLNTTLKVYEYDEGKAPKTVNDAFNHLKKSDIYLDQLTTKTDNEILYNLIENKFYLSNDEVVNNNPNKYEYWKIYNEVPEYEAQTYSIYLDNETLSEEVRVQVGIDVNTNTTIPLITYEREGEDKHTVTINSNGGNLVVDANNDTVYHYGTSDEVNVIKAGDSSYHAHATSNFTSISKGRIVIEKDTSINGLYINENDVIVAINKDAVIPTISRNESVSTIELQVVNDNYVKEEEATISIVNNNPNLNADINTIILDSLLTDLSSSKDQESSRLASKYEAFIGDAVLEDESNCYETIEEALSVISSASAAQKLYLLKNLTVDSPITISCTTKYAHTIYLNSHTIKGNDCTPIIISALKTSFVITGPGSLEGDANNPCIINNTSYQITLTSIDTIGAFENNAKANYMVINNGTHTLAGFRGVDHFRLDAPNSNAIFDTNVSDKENKYRINVVDNNDGTWTVKRITATTQTANGWTKIQNASNTFEKYDTAANFIKYADYSSYSMKLLANVTGDVNTNTTKAITINANKKKFTGELVSKGALSLNSGSLTGTFDISKIGGTTFTVGKNSNITISDGTLTGATTFSGASTTLTANNCTFGAITLSGASSKLIADNCTFGAITLSGVSSSISIDNSTLTSLSLSGTSAAMAINNSELSSTISVTGASSSLTIENTTVTGAITLNANLATLIIESGTFESAITVYINKTNTLTINGGTFKAKLTKKNTSSVKRVFIQGGSYTSKKIYDTYKNDIADGYVGNTSTYTVGPANNN